MSAQILYLNNSEHPTEPAPFPRFCVALACIKELNCYNEWVGRARLSKLIEEGFITEGEGHELVLFYGW